MSTLEYFREALHETWDSIVDGWQKLSQKASGAITRFGVKKSDSTDKKEEIATRSSGWGVMASEVFDDGDKLVVRLEAPGMEKEDFDINVVEKHLVVRGEKRIERERTEGNYKISECAYGHFSRAIPLHQDVDVSKAIATYKKGVLRIELPKKPSKERDVISIDVN
ncbi:MAG: Hsp20/alpha crystallin family protein [Flavobacteriaceae bacterium TMED42]|nr:MAG: Hsp20/alpha crystallin family protein [Flavobacteriaceae bacterium TMED42]